MSKDKIIKNTTSYHDELIASLKKPQEADLYLRIAMEEYHEDGDVEALLIALRNIAEAKVSYFNHSACCFLPHEFLPLTCESFCLSYFLSSSMSY